MRLFPMAPVQTMTLSAMPTEILHYIQGDFLFWLDATAMAQTCKDLRARLIPCQIYLNAGFRCLFSAQGAERQFNIGHRVSAFHRGESLDPLRAIISGVGALALTLKHKSKEQLGPQGASTDSPQPPGSHISRDTAMA